MRASRRLAMLATALLTSGAALLAPLNASAAGAAPPPQFGLAASAGTCVALPGQLTLTFGGPLGLGNLSPALGLHGSLTCVGDPVRQTVYIDVDGSSLAFTCAGGEAILGGVIQGDTGHPPGDVVTATIVGEGPNVHLTLFSTLAVGVGDLVWADAAAIDGCPLGRTSSTHLVGSITFTSTG